LIDRSDWHNLDELKGLIENVLEDFTEIFEKARTRTIDTGSRRILPGAKILTDRSIGLIIIRDALTPPSLKIQVKLESEEARKLFSIFTEKLSRAISFQPKGDLIEMEVRDLISFLGKYQKLKMNPEIDKISDSEKYSLEEYHDLLKKAGFKKHKIKKYKFSKRLILKGISIDQNQLPETYCMLVYQK